MMRIGIDARMLGFSGVGRYTENLIRELLQIDTKNQYIIFVQKQQAKNFQFLISNFQSIFNFAKQNKVLTKSGSYSKFSQPKAGPPWAENIKIIETDAPIYSLKEQSNFLKTVNRQMLDVMHFTHFNVPIFYRKPYVVTIHDLTPLYYQGKKRATFLERAAYKMVLKNALKKSQKIVAISQFTKNDILKNFPFIDQEKIKVIYEGAISRFAPISNYQFLISNQFSNNQKPITNYLLYVGLWREHKNLLGLIRAFEKIKKTTNYKLQTTKLVIVGKPDPVYREVQDAAQSSPYNKDIIITGYV
ncbi:MAG: glycosyltransferase, partial [Actinobacteria bacterium]|nr:glycosyltransferase [Actinomycetota bacterium]